MKKILTILIVIIILAILSTFIIDKQTTNQDTPTNQQRAEQTKVKTNQDNQNSQLNSQTQETTADNSTAATGAGGGGGGGGGSEGTSNTQQNPAECEETQISYSLKNFEKNQTCTAFDGTTCIEKISSCSLLVTNLDEETTGLFTINFRHFPMQNQPNILHNESQTTSLEPDQQEIFLSTTTIQSTGEQGNANQEITCIFSSEQIPTKLVCS